MSRTGHFGNHLDMNGSERDLAELLRDGDWLRRFVATLVSTQDVDDVVQSTWLAALQGRPITRSVRNWLCGAAANIARLLHRKESRGARALRSVAAGEHEPAAADLVEALEVQRLVSNALLVLPEPTRTILVLRYQQRLPVATIAEQVGLQQAAVRQRLHRGREAVRERLQRRFGGDWRGCIAVGTFMRDHAVPVPVASGLALALGSVAVAGLTVALLASVSVRELAPPASNSGVTAWESVTRGAAAAMATTSHAADVGRIAVAPLGQEPAPAARLPPEIRGHVIAAEDERPLAGVRVTVSGGFEPGVPEAERGKMLPIATGADGTFAIPCPARVDRLDVWFRVEGRSPRHYRADPVNPVDLGDIPMRLGFQVKGRLIDEAGAPVARMRLAIAVPCGFPDDRNLRLSCTTDALGEFAWQDRVPAGPVQIECESAPLQLLDGKVEVVAKAEPNEFVLRCRRLPAISGVAFDVDGTPCANLDITAFDGPLEPLRRGLDNEVGRCRTREDGSFTLHRRKGEGDHVDLRSSMLFAELELFEPQTGVRWGTSGLRLQARPHADVELRVVDAENRAPIERFAAIWTFARGITRVSTGGGQPSAHAHGMMPIGRLAHGTRVLIWSADAMQAQIEVVVTDTMRGRTVIEVALPRMQSFPCVLVDANRRPLAGTFHVLDRNGTPAPQPWSDPRGGMTRTGADCDVYRLHTVVTDRDGKGSILAPTDGRELVVVRDGPDVRAWTSITLPRPGELLRVVIAD